MDIKLDIERIVLDGISIAYHERPLLQAALEAELGRLLAAGGLAPGLLAGGALSRLPAAPIQLAGQGDPAHLGEQIARTVYGSLHGE